MFPLPMLLPQTFLYLRILDCGFLTNQFLLPHVLYRNLPGSSRIAGFIKHGFPSQNPPGPSCFPSQNPPGPSWIEICLRYTCLWVRFSSQPLLFLARCLFGDCQIYAYIHTSARVSVIRAFPSSIFSSVWAAPFL